MKFLIHHTDGAGKTLAKISGFVSLEDACHTVMALAQRRRGQDNHYFYVRLKSGRHGVLLDGVSAEYLDTCTLQRMLARAQAALGKARAEARAAKARLKFLRAHGGFDGPLWPAILQHEDIKAAWFANDFANTLARCHARGIVLPTNPPPAPAAAL